MSDSVYSDGPDDADPQTMFRELAARLRETERELQQLREETNTEERDRRGPGGTPNLEGEVLEKLRRDVSDADWAELKLEGELHRAAREGPEAFVEDGNPVYAVHERAYHILSCAQQLARKEKDGAVFLTVPSVKKFLEAREGQHLKHTQVRRAFEQIQEAGNEYPRAPTIHKNADGIVEMVIYDYERLFEFDDLKLLA